MLSRVASFVQWSIGRLAVMGIVLGVVLAFSLSGTRFAANVTSANAQSVCSQVASEQGGTPVGAFDTTLEHVRALRPIRASSDMWAAAPDTKPAIACYIDGPVAKAPPGGEPFDRAVVVVVDGKADLVVAAYQKDYPVRLP